ncbi:hypothetical protein PHMEG_00025491 [Phytophthora megakarya]|uniref:Uncharacterized protein n=1 Tax=Phytophthora megakarya TaxID=4795 RepID=A0A225VCN9_9STRA|nr:hypothetical protein PHMEG_00025491 [Phytophthora megakarya]
MHTPSLVADWAVSTTEAWANEVKLEWKKKQRCETLSRFRTTKKKKFADLCRERDRLEIDVKRRLAALDAIANTSHGQNSSVLSAFSRLALECDVLRNDNQETHQKLQQFKRTWSLLQEGLTGIQSSSGACSTPSNLYDASEKSQWVRVNEPGWRVHFPNNEPSFYFHPFTRQEFDTIYKDSIDEYMVKPQRIELVGSLFGWAVHHAPLTRRLADNTVFAHTKFSMRAGVSVGEVDELVLKADLKWLPLIVTPSNWSDRQRDAISTQVLQEFELDAYILVCNIPGDVHLRYLFLVRRHPHQLPNGKRATTYSMAIADSEANARSRLAAVEHNVVWANEGSNLLTVTEVDEKTVDIKFEFKAACHDELHARNLFVYWTEFVCRWSERIVPPKLLQ